MKRGVSPNWINECLLQRTQLESRFGPPLTASLLRPDHALIFGGLKWRWFIAFHGLALIQEGWRRMGKRGSVSAPGLAM
jgi:hypothetical protein